VRKKCWVDEETDARGKRKADEEAEPGPSAKKAKVPEDKMVTKELVTALLSLTQEVREMQQEMLRGREIAEAIRTASIHKKPVNGSGASKGRGVREESGLR
jgi:hypothetical protein